MDIATTIRGASFRPEEEAELGARALSLAADALAPGAGRGVDLRLAQLLLREALVAAVRAVTGSAAVARLDDAIAAVAARPELEPLAPREALAQAVRDLAPEVPPEIDALLAAERLVAQLLRASGRRQRSRTALKVAAAVAVAIVLAAIVAAPLLVHTPRPWDGYRWRASSAAFGYLRAGTLGDRVGNDLLFHTQNEPKPWVIVDMGEPRTVGEITIVNRSDCCERRGLPIVVEASVDGASWTRVGERRVAFSVLDLRFPPRVARYLRVRSEAKTFLHFREIRIP